MQLKRQKIFGSGTPNPFGAARRSLFVPKPPANPNGIASLSPWLVRPPDLPWVPAQDSSPSPARSAREGEGPGGRVFNPFAPFVPLRSSANPQNFTLAATLPFRLPPA